MATREPEVSDFLDQRYQHGFYTDIEADTVPPGLNDDVIRLISQRKGEPEWMCEWRPEAPIWPTE